MGKTKFLEKKLSAMKFFSMIFSALVAFIQMAPGMPFKNTFRVATFNIFQCASHVNRGMEKVNCALEEINADIAAFQEAKQCNGQIRLSSFVDGNQIGGDVVDSMLLVDPRFPATTSWNKLLNANGALGVVTYARVNLTDALQLDIYNVHLDYRNDGVYCAARGNSVEKILECEKVRDAQIKHLISNFSGTPENDEIPKLVVGDFNTPSHLDWIESTKHLHFGKVVQWPALKRLADAGFKDSFREIHPDPLAMPGNTWSTFSKWSKALNASEPQNRIDFILYRGNIKPINSIMYGGPENVYNGKNQLWPSDHYAVYTDFEY